ncbi:MAG: glycosyl hydrolase, partial [Lentisphaerota bacterium]
PAWPPPRQTKIRPEPGGLEGRFGMVKSIGAMVLCWAFIATANCGQAVEITACQGPGELSWTNERLNASYTIEWAPNTQGPWTNWPGQTDRPVTAGVMSAEIPMLFRVSIATNGGQFVPPGGKTLLLIGQDTNSIDTYVRSNSVIPGGVMFYTSVQTADGLTAPADYGGGVQFGQYLVDHFTNSALQIGLYMIGALQGVTNGTYNANLDTLGNWMTNTHRPIYLRIGYEFDAPNNYEPAAYAAAFRYIVNRFRAASVGNVDYVWHSYAATVTNAHMAWYPGDEYVDWFGVSVFGQIMGTNWNELNAMARLAREHHKPLMIAEAAPMGLPTTQGINCWTSWFTRVFSYIQEQDVRALSYINCNWDEIPMFSSMGWGDSRVQSDPYVQAHWMQTITNGSFWNASPELFDRLQARP